MRSSSREGLASVGAKSYPVGKCVKNFISHEHQFSVLAGCHLSVPIADLGLLPKLLCCLPSVTCSTQMQASSTDIPV